MSQATGSATRSRAAVALQPLTMRRLLDLAVEEMRRHFRSIFLPAALPMAGVGLLLGLAQVQWMDSLMALGAGGTGSGFAGGLVLLLVVVLLALVLYMVCYTAVIAAAMDALAGRPVQMSRSWRTAVRPRVFLATLMLSMLVMASMMACFFPVLYIAPLLCLALPALLEEELGGVAAIGRSIELGHFNPTSQLSSYPWIRGLLIYFVWILISYSLSLVVQLPFQIAQQLLMFREAVEGEAADPLAMMGSWVWLQVPSSILGMLATVVGWLYLAFAVGLLYRETRRLKEGGDLERAINELTDLPAGANALPPG